MYNTGYRKTHLIQPPLVTLLELVTPLELAPSATKKLPPPLSLVGPASEDQSCPPLAMPPPPATELLAMALVMVSVPLATVPATVFPPSVSPPSVTASECPLSASPLSEVMESELPMELVILALASSPRSSPRA